MDKRIIKLHAAYCAGLVKTNPIEACYPLLENAVLSVPSGEFSEETAKEKFDDAIGDEIPLGVIREILAFGLKSRRLTRKRNVYSLRVPKEDKSLSDFESDMNLIIKAYGEFCQRRGYVLSDDWRTDFIDVLDLIDADVLATGKTSSSENADRAQYFVCEFINECADEHPDLFEIINCICACNLTVQSLLYAPGSIVKSDNLTIYIDTPIFYSLLGLSGDYAKTTYEKIVDELLRRGCRVAILDRHLSEFDEAVHATARWTFSEQYNSFSASPTARLMRQRWKSLEECSAALESLKNKLLSGPITVRRTEYNHFEDGFQIDELALQSRIERLYKTTEDKVDQNKRRIETDAIAMSMVYRMRHGNVAYRIENTNHLLVTSNAALAKAAKLFEREMRKGRKQSMTIPACVHADLIASTIWSTQKKEFDEYRKDKLLSLCYERHVPSPALLIRFSEQLKKDVQSGIITDDEIVLMRSGAVADSALMLATNGDPDNVSGNTAKQLLNSITEKERSRFDAERAQYKRQIQDVHQQLDIEKKKNEEIALDMQNKKDGYRVLVHTICSYIVMAITIASSVILAVVYYLVFGRVTHALILSAVLITFEWFRMGSRRSIIGRMRCILENHINRRYSI